MKRLSELDGLRGYAALSVFVWHALDIFYPRVVQTGIAGNPTAVEASMLGALGFPIGALVNGIFAVILFFVLSGFVLTVLMLSPGSRVAPGPVVAQRLARLFPVAAVGSIIAFAMLRIGLFSLFPLNELNGTTRIDVYSKAQMLNPTVKSLLSQVFYEIWHGGEGMLFDRVLWTIGIEFRASIILMMWLAATGYCRGRTAAQLGGLLVGGLLVGSHYACFAAGSWLGELWVRDVYPRFLLNRWVGLLATAVALVAGSVYPDFDGRIWFWVDSCPPPLAKTWVMVAVYTVGGCAAVVGALAAGAPRALLAAQPGRLLGHISYAFYAVHQPILYSLGAASAVTVAPRLGYNAAVAVGTVAALFASLTLGWILTDTIDLPFNLLSKRLTCRALEGPGAVVLTKDTRVRAFALDSPSPCTSIKSTGGATCQHFGPARE
jgi:peptidoglycan/LPS O-acetylase OafA/YrhL